jgi:glycosyltransferase involved in cell wall biosynthesis
MKIVAAMCTYNDPDYLDVTIQSFKWFPDKLFIIEGSWQSANAPPRSDQCTYDIINKHVDNQRVFLVQANEARERNQRQIGLNLAKEEKADWHWIIDSDEVYTHDALVAMRTILKRASRNIYGFRLNSYNFINSFNKWYHGDYWRIYRPTPLATFIMDNDVRFNDPNNWTPQIGKMPDNLKFYHYNYVKPNTEQFWRKMQYQAEQDPSFNQRLLPHYGCEKGTYKIPEDIPVYNFTGKHPGIMRNHPYFINNIYNDKNLRFQK